MARKKKSTKAKTEPKNKSNHYSWHFWFLHALTIFAMFMGYATRAENGTALVTTVSFGLFVYLCPLFLSVARNMMPRSLMLKFYKKCL
jgi:small-conductance mechanosensitive channel